MPARILGTYRYEGFSRWSPAHSCFYKKNIKNWIFRGKFTKSNNTTECEFEKFCGSFCVTCTVYYQLH